MVGVVGSSPIAPTRKPSTASKIDRKPAECGFFIVSPSVIVRNNPIASGTKQGHKRETDTTESPKLPDLCHKSQEYLALFIVFRNPQLGFDGRQREWGFGD